MVNFIRERMAGITKMGICLVVQLLVMVPVTVHSANEATGLKVGFYANSCPQAEAIATRVIDEAVRRAPSLGAALLRMYFHDCFVRGCEGSILLNSTEDHAEKDAAANSRSLRGYNIIDGVKAALEKICPGVVSCTDILAMASRDATAALGGPNWKIETGRRDGVISVLNEANANLPSPFADIKQLKESFISRGLTAKDLVVLSAAHNIGVAHCTSFSHRLYKFNGKDVNSADPSLDAVYMQDLRKKCAFSGSDDVLVQLDPGRTFVFEDTYFDLVAKRRGLFTSDAVLMNDPETRDYIESHRVGKKLEFFRDFAESMIKTGRIGVLTGTEGEIRKFCYTINEKLGK